MTVPCKHWSDCGVNRGGCCAKGLYGGRPSAGTCLKVCVEYDGPSRGLGDTIAKFTKLTGLKKIADAREKKSGKPCGCKGRQRSLNQRFPSRSVTGP